MRDLLIWVENVNRLLSADSQRMRTKIYPETLLRDQHYGYGVVLDQRLGSRLQYHGGGISGFSSVVQFYPDDRLSIAVLSNRDISRAKWTAWAVADRLAAGILPVKKKTTPRVAQ